MDEPVVADAGGGRVTIGCHEPEPLCGAGAGAATLGCCQPELKFVRFAFIPSSIDRNRPNVKVPTVRQTKDTKRDTRRSNPMKLSRMYVAQYQIRKYFRANSLE